MFNRGSFFFREDKWSVDEMAAVLFDVGERAIHYYLAKLGKAALESPAISPPSRE